MTAWWACRVWSLFQARCARCGWSGEIWAESDKRKAAQESRAHRENCPEKLDNRQARN